MTTNPWQNQDYIYYSGKCNLVFVVFAYYEHILSVVKKKPHFWILYVAIGSTACQYLGTLLIHRLIDSLYNWYLVLVPFMMNNLKIINLCPSCDLWTACVWLISYCVIFCFLLHNLIFTQPPESFAVAYSTVYSTT